MLFLTRYCKTTMMMKEAKWARSHAQACVRAVPHSKPWSLNRQFFPAGILPQTLLLFLFFWLTLLMSPLLLIARWSCEEPWPAWTCIHTDTHKQIDCDGPKKKERMKRRKSLLFFNSNFLCLSVMFFRISLFFPPHFHTDSMCDNRSVSSCEM